MASRHELHRIFEEILQNKNVYFQPPKSKKIEYPAIIYTLDNIDSTFADNFSYKNKKRYLATLIDHLPDNDRSDQFLKLSYCSFDRFYTNDNLNHWVYTIYF